MKKFVMVTTIAGVLCVAAGIGLVAVSAAMRGGVSGLYSDWADRYGWNDYREAGGYDGDSGGEALIFTDVMDLELETAIGNMELLESGDVSEITVDLGRYGDFYRCYQEEQILKIKVRDRAPGRRSQGSGTITVTVPAGYEFGDVSIEAAAGNVRSDGITAEDLRIEAAAGSVEMDHVAVAKSLRVECDAGKVRLSVTGAEKDYNYRLECNMGKITVGQSHYAGFASDKSIGNGAPTDIELECNVGKITVEFEESETLTSQLGGE